MYVHTNIPIHRHIKKKNTADTVDQGLGTLFEYNNEISKNS